MDDLPEQLAWEILSKVDKIVDRNSASLACKRFFNLDSEQRQCLRVGCGLDPANHALISFCNRFPNLFKLEITYAGWMSKLGKQLDDQGLAILADNYPYLTDWHGQEWELYLENLPKSVEASQILALDARYRLSESKDYEVKVAFLELAISCRCRDYYGEVEKSLKEVGRMKYLRPLYTALVQGSGKEEEKILAKRVFAEARESYHPIAQGVVESIFTKHV